MEARAATPADRLVYVADNPLKDFLAPKARGWRTLRIARPERIHRTPAPGARHEADGVIASLDELDLWLDRFGLAQGLGIVPA
jgi:putative hydrolase of the HAD superfamily